MDYFVNTVSTCHLWKHTTQHAHEKGTCIVSSFDHRLGYTLVSTCKFNKRNFYEICIHILLAMKQPTYPAQHQKFSKFTQLQEKKYIVLSFLCPQESSGSLHGTRGLTPGFTCQISKLRDLCTICKSFHNTKVTLFSRWEFAAEVRGQRDCTRAYTAVSLLSPPLAFPFPVTVALDLKLRNKQTQSAGFWEMGQSIPGQSGRQSAARAPTLSCRTPYLIRGKTTLVTPPITGS